MNLGDDPSLARAFGLVTAVLDDEPAVALSAMLDGISIADFLDLTVAQASLSALMLSSIAEHFDTEPADLLRLWISRVS